MCFKFIKITMFENLFTLIGEIIHYKLTFLKCPNFSICILLELDSNFELPYVFQISLPAIVNNQSWVLLHIFSKCLKISYWTLLIQRIENFPYLVMRSRRDRSIGNSLPKSFLSDTNVQDFLKSPFSPSKFLRNVLKTCFWAFISE